MPGDPAGSADEVAQDRLALDDPGVLRDVDRGRRLVREAREVGPTADRLELVLALERLGDRDDVDRLAPLEQLERGGIDPAVRLAIEVGRAKELGDLDDRIAVDQDGTEHGLLGLETLRRKAVDHAGRTPSAIGSLIVRSACPDRSTNAADSDPTVHQVHRPVDPPWTTSWISTERRCALPSRPALDYRESAPWTVEAKAAGEQESERTSRCVSERRNRPTHASAAHGAAISPAVG